MNDIVPKGFNPEEWQIDVCGVVRKVSDLSISDLQQSLCDCMNVIELIARKHRDTENIIEDYRNGIQSEDTD